MLIIFGIQQINQENIEMFSIYNETLNFPFSSLFCLQKTKLSNHYWREGLFEFMYNEFSWFCWK